MILHACVACHLRSTPINFGSRGQRSDLNFASFLHSNSFLLTKNNGTCTSHMIVVHMNPIDFGVKRSKVKVKSGKFEFVAAGVFVPLGQV